MKKHFTLLLMFISFWSFAQIAMSSGNQNSRWTFGGGLGIGFGSDSYFNLQVSPRVGYKITDQLEGGLSGNVSWQSSNFYKSTMFGFGPFANYYFGRSFFIGVIFSNISLTQRRNTIIINSAQMKQRFI